MSNSTPGTVFERPAMSTTSSDFTRRWTVNSDADRRGAPDGIQRTDIEKPRAARADGHPEVTPGTSPHGARVPKGSGQ